MTKKKRTKRKKTPKKDWTDTLTDTTINITFGAIKTLYKITNKIINKIFTKKQHERPSNTPNTKEPISIPSLKVRESDNLFRKKLSQKQRPSSNFSDSRCSNCVSYSICKNNKIYEKRLTSNGK